MPHAVVARRWPVFRWFVGCEAECFAELVFVRGVNWSSAWWVYGQCFLCIVFCPLRGVFWDGFVWDSLA